MRCVGRVLAALVAALALAPAEGAFASDAGHPLSLRPGHRPSEAHVAVDPRDPRDVLVVARDEGGGRLVRLRAWRSRDGGRTFRASMLVDGRVDGQRGEGSDPVALYDAAGQPSPAYLALRYGAATWDSRIVLGGRTVVVSEHPPPFPVLSEGFGTRRWHDKPWAAIDPHSGRAYVAWTQHDDTETAPVERIVVASAGAGEPFGAPVVVAQRGTGAQLAVRPDGAVVLAWVDKPNLTTAGWIRAARSSDGGSTWSAPVTIAAIPINDELSFPTLAADARGRLAVCWQQARRSGAGRIACARSADGRTWSRSGFVTGPGARQPALAAAGDGRFWLLFYRFDRRSTRVELWRSRDRARRWRRAVVLARRPFGPSPVFIGDYQGLAATTERVLAAFVLPRRPRGLGQQVLFASVAAR